MIIHTNIHCSIQHNAFFILLADMVDGTLHVCMRDWTQRDGYLQKTHIIAVWYTAKP